MSRLLGLFLFVNTLLPPILALVLIWGVGAVWTAVADHLAPPVNQIVADARRLADEAADAAATASEEAKAALDDAGKIAGAFSTITVPAALAAPSIPPMRIPKVNRDCKTTEFFDKRKRSTCLPLVDVLDPMSDAVGSVVDGVNAIRGSVEAIKTAAAALTPLAAKAEAAQARFLAQAEKLDAARAAIRAETRRVETAAFWAAILLGPWLALTYLVWAWGRLATSWRMLAGAA